MIKGIGTDIIELARIQKTDSERLARRILTKDEQQLLPSNPQRRLAFLAGRFAAKEAIAKALGTGIGADLSFRDIEIFPDHRGAPTVVMGSQWQKHHPTYDQWLFHLSISHCVHYAVAMAVIEQSA